MYHYGRVSTYVINHRWCQLPLYIVEEILEHKKVTMLCCIVASSPSQLSGKSYTDVCTCKCNDHVLL